MAEPLAIKGGVVGEQRIGGGDHRLKAAQAGLPGLR